MSEDRDPLEGVPQELRDWHQGALEGDPAVCAAEQPDSPDAPCILNRAYHPEHRDVFGNTWPAREERFTVAVPLPRNPDGTVTIPTARHGDVTTGCPDWCTGHTEEHPPIARVDITHTSEPVDFNADTDNGRVEVLSLMVQQWPFATAEADREVAATVIGPGDDVRCGPKQLRQIAAALTVHSIHMNTVAAQLAELRRETR
ncbi:DUF6907 domain-containing protein [Streptomyces sp. NPDC058653]|uniref:DUF6907 domain-containing protein n=1 Tax=Streptomyces sp. NPDC058653 TaxID=3346576 RepID=UPI00365FAAAB